MSNRPRSLRALMSDESLNDPLIRDDLQIFWTLPMVLAFIKWRTLNAVRWFENEELLRRGAVRITEGYDPSHFVSQKDLHAAENRFGPPFDNNRDDPFMQLLGAGKVGRIVATALPLRDGVRQDITDMRWAGLRLKKGVMELFYEADRTEPPYAYYHVLIQREHCLLEWWPAVRNATREARKLKGRGGRKAMEPEEFHAHVDKIWSSGKFKAHRAAVLEAVEFLGEACPPEGYKFERFLDRNARSLKKRFSEKSDRSSD